MGRELDSLADVISFGVAPAGIAYAAGLDRPADQAILMYFVGCGVSRLARYNVTAADLSRDTGKVTYFEGTPIPTGSRARSLRRTSRRAWAWRRRRWVTARR